VSIAVLKCEPQTVALAAAASRMQHSQHLEQVSRSKIQDLNEIQLGEDPKYLEAVNETRRIIQEKRKELELPSEVERETEISQSRTERFNQFKTRMARFVATRPALNNAVITALGDDLIVTSLALLRHNPNGKLNIMNASEEAFKGSLKFFLNVSNAKITEIIMKLAAKIILPDHLQDYSREIMRLRHSSLYDRGLLERNLKRNQLPGAWDHINNANIQDFWNEDDKSKELFLAEKSLKFPERFNPSDEELEKIKHFQLMVRFFEGGVKSSLWASIPYLNQMIRSSISSPNNLNKSTQDSKELAFSPARRALFKLSLGFGFLSQGGIILLHKLSKGTNPISKLLVRSTHFFHGLYPSKFGMYLNQGVAYSLSLLANSKNKVEKFENTLISAIFTPMVYFGEVLTRFINQIADHKLTEKYGLEPGVLVWIGKKKDGIQGLIKKIFPEEIWYGDMMPKIEHDEKLKSEAKSIHANMAIARIALHSLAVLATRLMINKKTEQVALKEALAA